jgi:hypothetical protein
MILPRAIFVKVAKPHDADLILAPAVYFFDLASESQVFPHVFIDIALPTVTRPRLMSCRGV